MLSYQQHTVDKTGMVDNNAPNHGLYLVGIIWNHITSNGSKLWKCYDTCRLLHFSYKYIFFLTIYESIPFIILRHLFADTFVMSKSQH